MAAIEALEDIKELNARHADIEIEHMLNQKREQDKEYALMKKQLEEDEDEAEIRYVHSIDERVNVALLGFRFSKAFGKPVVTPADDDDDDDDDVEETQEVIEEVLPPTVNTTKPKVVAIRIFPFDGLILFS